ncbi:MAG: alpha/beta hydrolase [Burkholderiales bacterium]|nr:alpha/beta hydrolase [Burkholderiales bacterium]
MADVVARGVRFNVVRMGEGPVRLVLIHGLVMDSHASYYLSIAPALARRGGVLLYDLRGHGRSEQPPAGYTMGDMVDDLIALLGACDVIAPVVLVGNSYGGQVALRAAVARPDLVRALVLIDPQLGVPDFRQELEEVLAADPEERDRMAYTLFGRWLAEHAAQRDPAARDTQAHAAQRSATIDEVIRHRKRRRSPGVRTAVGLARDTSLIADLARESAMGDDAIRRIACPVLAVFGEKSDLRADADRLACVMRDIELSFVPGMGHTVLLEAPAPLKDILLDWLARRNP